MKTVPATKTARILIVEDERTIAESVAARLRAEGFSVEVARAVQMKQRIWFRSTSRWRRIPWMTFSWSSGRRLGAQKGWRLRSVRRSGKLTRSNW